MAKSAHKFAQNPGMVLFISYVVLALVNMGVLWVAYRMFPDYIVLGTVSLTAVTALCVSMSKLAVIGTFAMPFFTQWELNQGRQLTPVEWMRGYFVINFVGLYLITRYSQVYGLGVTSWVVVAWLAVVFNLIQGAAMMRLEAWRQSD